MDASILARTIPVVVLGKGGKVDRAAHRSTVEAAALGLGNGADTHVKLEPQLLRGGAIQKIAGWASPDRIN